MNKFKKILLGALSVLTLGLFVVSTTEVNAATAVNIGAYTWKPEISWTSGTKGGPNVTTSGIYTAGGTAQRNSFGSLVSSGLTNEFSATKEWTYELRYYTGTPLQITIGDNQKADYEIYAYTSKGKDARTITVGTNTAHSLKSKTVEKFVGSVDGGTSSIVISGDSVCLLEATFTVSNSSSTKTLDRITISTSKTYYAGDTVLASDFSVTGIYIDDTTSEESSKLLDSSSYAVVVKKDNVAVENNVLTSGGTHVAHITVNDTQVSNTIEFNVNVATHGSEVIFNPSNLTAENFASSRIIDGTIFKILSTDSSKVRIDANNKSMDGFTFTKRLVFGGKAATTSCALLVKAPSAGKLIVYGMSNSSNSTRILGLYTSTLGEVNVSGFSNDGNEIAKYEYTIEAAGDYLLGAVASGFSIYYVDFETSILSFDAQFDAATEEDATKLRFIGTINGVKYADIADIKSVKFTFTFNNADRTCLCSALYQSINNGTDDNGDPVVLYPGNDGTLYVVFQLNKINKESYKGLKLTNCKLTVIIEDSTWIATHNNITLPQFNTVIQENA